MKINEWESSIENFSVSAMEIHQKFSPLSKALMDLSNILNLANILVRIKHNGLKRQDSRIDGPVLCSDVCMETSPSHKKNLPAINPTSIISQGVVEVRSQNLYGSKPSIDQGFEGGNIRLSVVLPSNTFEVRNQNLYGSKSIIARLYDGGNPRSATTFQNRIIEIEVWDQTVYGSESNLNYDEGRVSEVSGMKKMRSKLVWSWIQC